MRDGRVVGVRTRRGEVAAGRTAIVVAGHTSHVAAMAGLKLPVESHLLQAFVSEPIKPFVDHVISFHAELFYISQSDKGGSVFGGHIDGFNSYTQRGQFAKVQEVAQCAVALIPSVSRLRLLRHWAEIQDMTRDGSPFICRTSVRNLYLNGGWCRQEPHHLAAIQQLRIDPVEAHDVPAPCQHIHLRLSMAQHHLPALRKHHIEAELVRQPFPELE